MAALFKPLNPAVFTCKLILTMCFSAVASLAQSTDINFPSPVRANEIVGSIEARDIGDSRRTDHFYAFVGNPGDVLITVSSNNLNGDVDLFTLGSLRPLLKFTLYAESTSAITKSVYLRRRQDLVLRVEARSPNDDEGIYQIRLGGSFEPITGEALLAANESPEPEVTVPAESPRGTNTRRVSSVGARIPEPPAPPVEEVAVATPTPEPTPEPNPEPSPSETPAPTATPESPAAIEAPLPTPRRSRSKGPARRRTATRPAPRPVPKDETIAPTDPENKTKPAEEPEKEATPTPVGRGRRGEPSESAQEPEVLTGPRLLIEMRDGTRIERYMRTIKRVTVENNQIVVVNKLGRIERVRLSDVVRMSIEP